MPSGNIGLFNSNNGTLIDVPIDLRLTETHELTAEVTQIPIQDGSVVTDHIILHPEQVTIQVEIANSSRQLFSNTASNRAADAWGQFRSRLRVRELYDIVTTHATYRGFALTHVDGENGAPYNGRLVASLTFTEVNRTQLSLVEVSQEDLSSDIGPSASSTVNGGREDTITAEDVAGGPPNDTRSVLARSQDAIASTGIFQGIFN